MLLMRKPHIGSLNSVSVGEDRIECVKHTRLFSVTIGDRLSWSHYLTDVKKQFGSQTEPPEKEFVFVQKSTIGLVLQDNITIMFVWTWLFWGGCPNADFVHSLEVPDCRAARIIYNLPRDVPTDEVYRN